MPQNIRDKYEWIETGDCAAILAATCSDEWADIIQVLDDFWLHPDTWLVAGGNKGDLTADLDGRFTTLGWEETRIDVEVKGILNTDFLLRGQQYVAQSSRTVPSICWCHGP